MWGDFLKSWRAQRVDVYRVVMKQMIEMFYENSRKENRKKRKRANLHRNNNLLKTIRSQRHSNYNVFLVKKQGPGKERFDGKRAVFWAPAWAKLLSKGCLFENLENKKWHPNQTFYDRSALGLSKNGPPERFGKTHKKTLKYRSEYFCF